MSKTHFETMYSVREVASILKVTRSYVYLLIKQGRLPVYRFDGLHGRQCFRIGAEDLAAYKKEPGFRPPGRPQGRRNQKPAARKKLLAMLRENGGNIQAWNQVELGKRIGVTLGTVKRVVGGLKQEGLLTVKTKRLGRGGGAITTYSLVEGGRSTKEGDCGEGN